ncbi:MAG TPA: hypothetical protein VF175_19180 [Lacipirellula sp.]
MAGGSTSDIWAASVSGNLIHITGSGTINSFGSCPNPGAERVLVFDGPFTITHASAVIDCQGRADVSAEVGDRAIVRANTTTGAIFDLTRASGAPLGVRPKPVFATTVAAAASTVLDIGNLNSGGPAREIIIYARPSVRTAPIRRFYCNSARPAASKPPGTRAQAA